MSICDKDRFIIELCPPLNPGDIPVYFKKFECLLKFTNSFSIPSHPSGQVSGFDRSYNLASFLRHKSPNINILFHITCNDLNRVNILSRLTSLRALQIKRILVITGENYRPPDSAKDLRYIDSCQLTAHILQEFDWFDSVGIAGYPGDKFGRSNQEECIRLRNKMKPGIDRIYTQCIFKADEFKLFSEEAKDALRPGLEIVPSVAIYNDTTSLSKVSRLTRLKLDDELLASLQQFESIEKQKGLAKSSNIKLCRELMEFRSNIQIIICAFGLFEFTKEILEELISSEAG